MKFLFISPRFHTNLIPWINSLKKNLHSVEMFTIYKGHIENYDLLRPNILKLSLISKILIKLFGPGGSNYFIGYPKVSFLYKQIKKSNPDIVIIRDFKRWFSLLSIFLSILLRKNIIIYNQNPLHSKYQIHKKLAYKYLKKFFNIIWITPIIGNKNLYNDIPKEISFIPFIYSSFVLTKKNNDKKINILNIAKFEKRKNHEILIQALKELLLDNEQLFLTIIGEKTTNEHDLVFSKLKKIIYANDLSKKILILTNINHKDIAKYYTDNDIFILPSTKEPASISIIEALSFGLPVICSKTCGTSNYIKDGYNGLLFEDNSLPSLKENILKILYKKKYIEFKNNILKMNNNLKNEDEFYNKLNTLIKLNF